MGGVWCTVCLPDVSMLALSACAAACMQGGGVAEPQQQAWYCRQAAVRVSVSAGVRRHCRRHLESCAFFAACVQPVCLLCK